MRSQSYGDILARPSRPSVPEVPAEPGLVVEDASSGFCGALIGVEHGNAVLEDAHGGRRVFPLVAAGFLLEGRVVTLVEVRARSADQPATSESGSVRVEGARARTARESRIWVEGKHDAELIERIWGHDLRVEGVVVEPMDGVDELGPAVTEFSPGPGRRLGILVDHLVAGSKESRLVADVEHPEVLVTGHPYVDIWQAVKPASVGIPAWPEIPRDTEWKEGVCAELGWPATGQGWQRVLAAVNGFRDVEPPLINAMEQLIDFVTTGGT